MEQLNSYKPSRRDVLRDALLAALFAACLITILEYIGFNEEVNAEALRLAVSLVGHPQDSADTDPPAAAVMPAVVLFSQAWYESYFNQTSYQAWLNSTTAGITAAAGGSVSALSWG